MTQRCSIFFALITMVGCSLGDPGPSGRNSTLVYRGTVSLDEPLANHDIQIFDVASSKKIAETTTNEKGEYTLPVLANYGLQRIEVTGPKLAQTMEIFTYTSIDDIARDAIDFHIHPMVIPQSARLEFLVSQNTAPDYAHRMATQEALSFYGFLPSEHSPSFDATQNLVNEPAKIHAWVAGLQNLPAFINRKYSFAHPAPRLTVTLENILKIIRDDIAEDGEMDGKPAIDGPLKISYHFLRGEMASSVVEVQNLRGMSTYHVSMRSWLRSMAIFRGSFLTPYESYYDVEPPVFTFPGTDSGEVMPEQKTYVCQGKDGNLMGGLRAWIQQDNTRYAETTTDTPQGNYNITYATNVVFNRPSEFLDGADTFVECEGIDVYGNFDTAKIPLTSNTCFGDFDVSSTPVGGNSSLVEIKCDCPDALATCNITYPLASSLQDCTLTQDMHRCYFDTATLPYDDAVAFVCQIQAPGLFPTTTATYYTPDNYKPARVKLRANTGFPLVGGRVEVLQYGTNHRVDMCTATECRTDGNGDVTIDIGDLTGQFGEYKGFLDVRIYGGRQKTVIGYSDNIVTRAIITYAQSRRVQELDDVVLNSETTIAASFVDGMSAHIQPTESLRGIVDRVHMLFAQRLHSCQCANLYSNGALSVDRYNRPGEPCYVGDDSLVAVKYRSGEYDIRKVLPLQVDSIGDQNFPTDFASKIALTHAAYASLENALHIQANGAVGISYAHLIDLFVEDASDGVWNGISAVGNSLAYGSRVPFTLSISRTKLGEMLALWFKQRSTSITPHLIGPEAVIPNLGMCANALYDSGTPAPMFDNTPPSLTAYAPAVVTSTKVPIYIETSDAISAVAKIQADVLSPSGSVIISQSISPTTDHDQALVDIRQCQTGLKIKITSTDTFGNTSEVIINTACDNTPPRQSAVVTTTFMDHNNTVPKWVNGLLNITENAVSKDVTESALANLSFTAFVHQSRSAAFMPTVKFKTTEESARVEYSVENPFEMGTEDSTTYIQRLQNPPDYVHQWQGAQVGETADIVFIPLTLDRLCATKLCREQLIATVLTDSKKIKLHIRDVDQYGNASAIRTYNIKPLYRFAPSSVSVQLSNEVQGLKTTGPTLSRFFRQGDVTIATLTIKNPIDAWTAEILTESLSAIKSRGVSVSLQGVKTFWYAELGAAEIRTTNVCPIDGPQQNLPDEFGRYGCQKNTTSFDPDNPSYQHRNMDFVYQMDLGKFEISADPGTSIKTIALTNPTFNVRGDAKNFVVGRFTWQVRPLASPGIVTEESCYRLGQNSQFQVQCSTRIGEITQEISQFTLRVEAQTFAPPTWADGAWYQSKNVAKPSPNAVQQATAQDVGM